MATADMISATVNRNGEMDVKNLAKALDKSEATIRNALNKGVDGVRVTRSGKRMVARPLKRNNDNTTTHSTGKKGAKLDRKTVRNIGEEMERELEAVAKKYGVQIERGGATFDPNGNFATYKIKVSTVADDGTVMSKEAEDFKRKAGRFGLDPEMLGKGFKHNGETFTVVGLAAKAKKYPVLVERADGKAFKMPSTLVRRAMAD